MATMLFTALSKFEKRITLSEKTWQEKICVEHPEFWGKGEYLDEVKRTIEDPDFVVKGWASELLALRWCSVAPKAPKYLCVVYRELDEDGFVITSFFISRYGRLLKREVAWQRS